jgi:SNF2 family DNA or RNA helicase
VTPVGEVSFDKETKTWRVTCQPHIALRFKRVFGGVHKNHVGGFVLSDTPDIAMDLKWFTGRFPLVFKDCLEHLERQAEKFQARADVVEVLLSQKYAPPEFELALPPREYQKEAAGLLLATGALLIADDLGVGKTCSAICAMSRKNMLPCFVVTLTHLPFQWREQLKKFAPTLTTHIVRGARPYDIVKHSQRFRDREHRLSSFPDVVILNFAKLAGWAEIIARMAKFVVWDEVQELRRNSETETSRKYAAAKLIAERVPFKVGLSGTPFFNYGGEMFNVMNCIAPGALGTHEEFAIEWCGGSTGDKAEIKEPKAFGMYLRSAGLMLRRTRKDVGRELPACTSVIHTVDVDEEVLLKASGQCEELARRILAETEAFRGDKMNASEQFSNMMRKACGVAKAPYCAAFVRMLIEQGERPVLFGWHHQVYAIWRDLLKDFNPAFYTGLESPSAKNAHLQRFIRKETPLMIMSLRAGAGVDGLQHVSRTPVFGELDWSPAVHEQCTGRIYRDGQPDVVFPYFLVADTISDNVMMDTLGIKDQQISGVRDPNLDIVEKLSIDPEHIKKLAIAYLKSRGAEAHASSKGVVLGQANHLYGNDLLVNQNNAEG